MEADQFDNKAAGPCDLPHCSKRALYKCPRCFILYCSVKCYQAHSTTCVNAFEHDASQCLLGLKPSSEHRRNFNTLLHRLRNDPASHFAQEGLDDTEPFPDADENHDEHDNNNDNNDHSNNDSDDDGNVDGNVAELLTRLMDDLPESGKDALFTALAKGMEMQTSTEQKSKSQAKAAQSPQSTEQPSNRTTAQPKADKQNNTKDAPEDDEQVLDALEQVVQEMEATELTYEQLASRLPPALLRDFETRVQKGETHDLVTAWTPWWTTGKSDQPSSCKPDLPNPADQAICISTARGRASPQLIYHVTEVIIIYCHALRRLNGDWSADALTMADELCTHSSVLSSDSRYDHADGLAKSVFEHVARAVGAPACAMAFQDAISILTASDGVPRALEDCRRLLASAGLEARAQGERLARKRFVRCERKIAFFVAWVLGEASRSFRSIADRLAVFLEDRGSDEVSIARRAVRSIALPETGAKMATAAIDPLPLIR